jgi:hypothetical protein
MLGIFLVISFQQTAVSDQQSGVSKRFTVHCIRVKGLWIHDS